MLEEEFDGIVLGGILFEKESVTDPQMTDSVGIKNENIGIPDLILRDIEMGLKNYRAAVTAIFQNPTPTVIRDLSIEGNIYKDGEDEVYKTASMSSEAKIAPNSTMDFVIDWGNQRLEEGSYEFIATAVAGEYKWDFQKNFTIEDKVARITNKEAVDIERDDTPCSIFAHRENTYQILLRFRLVVFFVPILIEGMK